MDILDHNISWGEQKAKSGFRMIPSYTRSFKALLGLLLVLAVLSALPAFGGTVTVTNTNDSGAGSLRAAIASASSGDTINFSVTGTITLTTGVLEITNSLTITGPGASTLAISGGGVSGVFIVDSGATVTISGLTIENGSASGILNNGTLTVTNSTLSGNSAGGGSGGGGIFNLGILTVTNSTISGNSATGGVGGGIYSLGTLTVTNSAISGNSASSLPFKNGGGGGIYNDGKLTVTNSTLSGNNSPGLSNGLGGGGIYNNGTLTVTNSTLSGNYVTGVLGGGGGIYNNVVALTVKNSIVANNGGGNCAISGSALTSQGHNLSDDTSCSGSFTATGDVNNTPVGLDSGGLKDNGGPTQTIALLPTSPAVDAIPTSPTNYCTATDGVTPIATDQRGTSRPQGPVCDIGAFEYQPVKRRSQLTSD